MIRICYLPDEDKEISGSPFSDNLRKIAEKHNRLEDSVCVCMLKDYLTYFPNANDVAHISYYSDDKSRIANQRELNEAISELKDLDLKFRINRFLIDERIKIFILVGYPDAEAERNFLLRADGIRKQGNADSRNNSGDGEPHLNIKPVEPKFRLSQMVLNQKTKDSIDHCVMLIRNMDKIYGEWGFSQIDPVQKTVLNFFGPSGTGKTMAAHAIANEIGRKILAVNYAEIESKYVGDAPKNLISAFDIAKKENAVLFFDEADSFLGKRITNVSSSSDQAVNSLRSQMLILLESYDITVIFATNLNENYDKAFNSRILESIKFDLPDKELRKDGIRKSIPDKAPKADGYDLEKVLDRLSEISEGFSFREIKNSVLSALVECCRLDAKLSDDILEKSFTAKKEEIEALKDDKKKKIGAQIKEKLDKGEYTIHRREELEGTGG